LQPDSNDLLLATHGRGAYVLDDVTPLQQLARARAAGTFLFPVRPAIMWQQFSYWATPVDGEAPPYGAIVSYYLSAPSKDAPTAEILDAHGRVVRRYDTEEKGGKRVPMLSNGAGVNRFIWDFAGEPAHEWPFAPSWNRGYTSGVPMLPGTYTVRLHVDGHTLETHVHVNADPRTHYTLAQLTRRQDAVRSLLDDLSRLDDGLTTLSTVAQEAPLRARAIPARAITTLAFELGKLPDEAEALIATATSNPRNDQDNDFLTDALRERLQTELDTYFEAFAPPTAERAREDAELHRLTAQRLQAFAAFSDRVAAFDAQLKAQGAPPLETRTVARDEDGEMDSDDRR